MNQFLYRIQPARTGMITEGPTQREAQIVEAHVDYLQGLVSKGVVLMAGRTLVTDESTFGVVVFEADSEKSAQIIMENDPAVSNGVMIAQLFPYRVALWSNQGPTEQV